MSRTIIVFFFHIINPVLTKLVRFWLDISTGKGSLPSDFPKVTEAQVPASQPFWSPEPRSSSFGHVVGDHVKNEKEYKMKKSTIADEYGFTALKGNDIRPRFSN